MNKKELMELLNGLDDDVEIKFLFNTFCIDDELGEVNWACELEIDEIGSHLDDRLNCVFLQDS